MTFSFALYFSSALQEHSHDQKKYIFRCESCHFAFAELKHLEEHKARKHSDPSFNCDKCRKAYSTQHSLSRHITSYHKNPGTFECSKCDRKFNRKDLLNKHLTKHSENKNFICNICDKALKSKCALSAHISGLHLKKRVYKCDDCGFETKWKSNYTQHKTIHTGEESQYRKRRKRQQNGARPDFPLNLQYKSQ